MQRGQDAQKHGGQKQCGADACVLSGCAVRGTPGQDGGTRGLEAAVEKAGQTTGLMPELVHRGESFKDFKQGNDVVPVRFFVCFLFFKDNFG